ncbi:hypothetical protein [Egbenema bharatensis]|uniref:hypothetical protein n=1 Tax=Egbenema bharatensis TaxID=3463334 RepID=UPI003A8A209E
MPLIALAVVTAAQSLPYFVGANIGTSTTAIIAATALASDGDPAGVAALNLAFVHLILEFFAIAILFPIRQIRHFPVWLAEHTAGWFGQGRFFAFGYIALLFYLLPFGGVWLTGDLEIADFYEPVVPQEVQELEAGEADAEEVEEDVEGVADADDADDANGDNGDNGDNGGNSDNSNNGNNGLDIDV